MLVTAKGCEPLLVSVVLSEALAVPTTWLPNFRLVGLTEAAGSTFSVIDFEMPLALPEICTVLLAVTALVAMAKFADCNPCGTTMLAATGAATDGWLLAS